jgi:hypothetical protein
MVEKKLAGEEDAVFAHAESRCNRETRRRLPRLPLRRRQTPLLLLPPLSADTTIRVRPLAKEDHRAAAAAAAHRLEKKQPISVVRDEKRYG